MNAYAKANKEFRTSAEMIRLAAPASLGAASEQRRFIENRLLEAFRLGVTAGEQIAADRIARFVRTGAIEE